METSCCKVNCGYCMCINNYRLTCYTIVNMEESMPLIDVNGFEHTVSQKHATNALIFGWTLFIMGVLCNVAYYQV